MLQEVTCTQHIYGTTAAATNRQDEWMTTTKTAAAATEKKRTPCDSNSAFLSSSDKSTSTGVYLFLLPYFFCVEFFSAILRFAPASRRNGICWMWTPGNTCLLWIKLKLKTKNRERGCALCMCAFVWRRTECKKKRVEKKISGRVSQMKVYVHAT